MPDVRGADARARSRAGAPVQVRLPGELSSAAEARRLLRRVLREAGKEQWLEAAELACTEVVSNAVLHAHTDVDLALTVSEAELRVEVRDASASLPVQRAYTGEATTGRGMALVAALTHQHGISDVDETGKTVWFTVRDEPVERSEDDLLAAWDDADWGLEELLERAPSGADAVEVVLLGLPPALWLASRQHHDALVRELQLHLVDHPVEGVDVAATDRARATISTAVVAAVERARAAGTARRPLPEGHPIPLEAVPALVDLPLRVPRELGPAFGLMQDTLDAGERLARSGALLVRPGLPEVVAVRDWACEQVQAQLAGVAPSPWPGTDQERFTTDVRDRRTGPSADDADLRAVRDADRGVVAADEANRIVAVSRSLADLVGWPVDELVGRRVVTLVPPALREAHVAGFTRHLTTGEAHALDVPLRLPVLHRDGHEVDCTFLVQRAPASAGRPLYFAWIEAFPGS